MDIFKYITDSGLPPFLLFLLFVLIAVFYFFGKSINLWIKGLIRSEQKHQIIDLKSHDIFNTLERVKKEVYFMKFYTHGNYDSVKTAMCQDFTKFKCDTCFEHFSKFLSNDFSKVSNDQLKKMVLIAMNRMHDAYIKETKNHWLNKGISKDDAEYVINLFEKFRYDVVVSFQHRIESIFASDYHSEKFDKVLACYDMFAMGVDLLPKDLLTTFETLNGRFQNINYI